MDDVFNYASDTDVAEQEAYALIQNAFTQYLTENLNHEKTNQKAYTALLNTIPLFPLQKFALYQCGDCRYCFHRNFNRSIVVHLHLAARTFKKSFSFTTGFREFSNMNNHARITAEIQAIEAADALLGLQTKFDFE